MMRVAQTKASAPPSPEQVEPASVDDGWTALCAAEDAAIAAARRRQVLGEAASGNPTEAKLPRVGRA